MHRMNEKIRKNICPEKPKLKIHPEHRGTIDRQPEYQRNYLLGCEMD